MLAGLTLSTATARAQQFDFRYSDGALRDDEIFDSALSGPGRYMLEIGRRIFHADPNAKVVVVANPLLPLRAAQLAHWLADGMPADEALIAADANKFPVFYILPRRLFEGLERFLLLLSAQDADLDARLLAGVLAVPVAHWTLGIPALNSARGVNGWLNGDRRLEALKLQCTKAVAIVERGPDWKRLPFVNYYPMHAGDVLFMGVASRMVPKSFFDKQVVCTAYADIPDACGSTLETIRLKLPWISRDGSVSELTYFTHALERLGEDIVGSHFFVFSRILRLYYTTPFHLVDHARFAQGASLTSFEQTLHAVPTVANRHCQTPPAPLRVLFHLNGGWSLKTYPIDSIKVAIAALRAAGVEVSVIDRPDLVAAGAVSLISEDSAALRAHVEAHHVFVGVDSFPHHYTRLVLGWPTIGLFGNTKPCNSDALYGAYYQSSDQGLSCNRCGAYDVCPVFERKDCVNYAPPERVVADIFDMAQRIYGFNA